MFEENNMKYLEHLERVGGVSLLLSGIPCKNVKYVHIITILRLELLD